MEYTEFGKTQLRVSRMCLGTWGIGGAGWDSYSDESRMDAIMPLPFSHDHPSA